MFTKKQVLLLVTLLVTSNSTFPMFNAASGWLNQAGNTLAENRGTAGLVGGACALGAVAYYVWKKLTRRAKTIVPVQTPQSAPIDFAGVSYPKLSVRKQFKPALQDRFIAAVYANEIDCLRNALRSNEFSINDVDASGNTLLHHALLSDAMQEATITFLINANIDINNTNNAGCTAYAWANFQGKLAEKQFEILNVLNSASA